MRQIRARRLKSIAAHGRMGPMSATPRRSYFLHRWLGAVVGLQLLAWITGGIIFSSYDMARVRGELTRRSAEPPALALDRVRIDAAAAAQRSAMDRPISVELNMLLDRPVFVVRGAGKSVLIDAESGTLRAPIDRATAEAIARADQKGEPRLLGRAGVTRS
jgi:hypothetical protein